jgi:hypothetical protein
MYDTDFGSVCRTYEMGDVFLSRVCILNCTYQMGVRNGNDLSRDVNNFGLGSFFSVSRRIAVQ